MPIAVMSTLLAGLVQACTCESADPEVNLVMRFVDRDLRDRATTVTATLTAGAIVYVRRIALPTNGRLEENHRVALIDVPTGGDIPLSVEVAAFGDAPNEVLARAADDGVGVANGCNQLVVQLGGPSAVDGGVDGGADGGDPGGMDGGETPDGGVIAEPLAAFPSELGARWVDRGDEQTFALAIRSGTDVDVSGIELVSASPGLTVSFGSRTREETAVSVEVDTTLAAGRYVGTVILGTGDGDRVTVPVEYRLFERVHVGVGPQSCVRTNGNSCDYSGEAGIREAVENAREYDHITVYAAGAEPAVYSGLVAMGANTWLSSAPGTEEDLVVMQQPSCLDRPAIVQLTADGLRVEGFTIVASVGCSAAITSWPSFEPTNGTEGHEILRMRIAALAPEIRGVNNLQFPLGLSASTTVAFSYFYGYWESIGDLSNADDSLIAHNTFVYYQDFGRAVVGGSNSNVEGVAGLKIVNNVFVALPVAREALLRADAQTRGLVVQGNVFRGFSPSQATIFGQTEQSNQVEDAPDRTSPLLSPIEPLFLTAQLPSSFDTSVSGVSLDGVVVDGGRLEGGALALPGAFQTPSSEPAPRELIRVGPAGCEVADTCDISAAEDNEVQLAAWSVWPGGRVEIAPSGTAYAGNVVTTWPIEIAGGGNAAEVVFQSRFEDAIWARALLWRHNAVVTATRESGEGLLVSNVGIELNASTESIVHGIFIEGSASGVSRPTLRSTSVRFVGTPNAALLGAIVAGSHTFVQDTLIQGPWRNCVSAEDERPTVENLAFVNVTCRLNGASTNAPSGAIEVSNVTGADFINWVAEVDPAAPVALFHAPGLVPVSFDARAIHYVGFGAGLSTRFSDADGTYVYDQVDVLTDAPFVDANDSRLRAGTASIDSGVNPMPWVPAWSSGFGLDGTPRTGMIDRGAYEQGM